MPEQQVEVHVNSKTTKDKKKGGDIGKKSQ
jgi:hypothetical protein